MSEEPAGDVVRGERFSGGPARGFLSSLAADERIFRADLQVDRAHAVMLAEQGIVTDAEATEILRGLAAVERAGHADLPDGEDVHSAIETAVIDRVGPVGGKMHTGRSRNDEVATCLRHRLRSDIVETVETVLAFRESLCALAERERETTMPGFTHLQFAQPTTVGHYLLSYESALARDTERLLAAFDRTNRSPLGAAAFAGTTFDIDRDRTAELLGFDSVIENSTDAVSARDFLTETTAALATLATTLSGIAEDLIIFASEGYVKLHDDYASTSSIMPQKKNPDSLELVRAVAGDASAGLDGLLTTLKGLPRAYNRDLQRAHGHAFETIDTVTEATTVAAGAVATADWNADVLATEAGEGFSTATGVADLLAAGGLPFRTAHELVARAAEQGADRAAIESAAAESGVDLDEYIEPTALDAALDPDQSVASRDSYGGPAPEAVASALDRATADVADAQAALAARTETLTEGETLLETEVASYV
ncbi:argininosuccinate lyase [Halobacteriales archaeon SW_8_65_20]|nr:MAG: argininosuccinate lyase [Halobacteriales archaeon SW_8_65_20]